MPAPDQEFERYVKAHHASKDVDYFFEEGSSVTKTSKPKTAKVSGRVAARHRAAVAAIAHWEEVKKQARAQIEAEMGDAELGVDSETEQPLIDWKFTKSRDDGGRFNQSAHKAAEPDCHALYTEMVSGRRMTFRAVDDEADDNA